MRIEEGDLITVGPPYVGYLTVRRPKHMPTRAALPLSQTTNSVRSALSSRLRPLSIVCIGHENDI